MSAKPFDPTPARLARARRDGDHPLSHDVVAAAAFVCALLTLAAIWPPVTTLARETLRGALSGGTPASSLLILTIPAVAVSLAGSGAAFAATLAQTHGLVVRIPPFRLGFVNVFGAQAWAAALRGFVAIVLAACGLAATIRPQSQAIGEALGIVVAIGAANAAVDVYLTRAAWRRRLRMTHDELRRDLRENDGDPETRTRRKRLHGMVLRGSIAEVRRASFLVVNPTHVAVALRYAPPQTPVPTILVKAAGDAALRARAIAREARVPVIEDVTLARELYALGSLGPIPRDLYLAVAYVVAALQRSQRR